MNKSRVKKGRKAENSKKKKFFHENEWRAKLVSFLNNLQSFPVTIRLYVGWGLEYRLFFPLFTYSVRMKLNPLLTTDSVTFCSRAYSFSPFWIIYFSLPILDCAGMTPRLMILFCCTICFTSANFFHILITIRSCYSPCEGGQIWNLGAYK